MDNKNAIPEEQKKETMDTLIKTRTKWRTIFVLSIVPFIGGIGGAAMATLSETNHSFLGKSISPMSSFLFDLAFVFSVGSIIFIPSLIFLIISIIKLKNTAVDIDFYNKQVNNKE